MAATKAEDQSDRGPQRSRAEGLAPGGIPPNGFLVRNVCKLMNKQANRRAREIFVNRNKQSCNFADKHGDNELAKEGEIKKQNKELSEERR